MSHDFNPDFVKIRRGKKIVSDEAWIKSFLEQAPAGVLATIHEDQPFLSTKLFVYDENRHAIYMHSADEGRVWQNVHTNPKACFTTYEMGRLIPAPRACKFGVKYKSVVVFGTIHVVDDVEETIAVLQLFMDKYAPHLKLGEAYPPISKDELGGLAVYRMEILGWSAKEDKENPDTPGAYRYEDLTRG